MKTDNSALNSSQKKQKSGKHHQDRIQQKQALRQQNLAAQLRANLKKKKQANDSIK